MATAKKLPSGSYRVLAYVGTVDGKRQYKSFTAGTKKEAEYQATLYAVKKHRENTRITAGQAIERYIDSKSSVLSPKTIKEYRGIQKRAFHAISKIRIDMLTDELIQREINTLSASLSSKTVRNAYALLNSSIKLFDKDFSPSISLPQKSSKKVVVPKDKEVQLLLANATGPLYTAILLTAALGLRRSEMCALEWEDISGKALSINKAMVMNADKVWTIKEPKTKSSTRTLELPDVVIQHLSTLKKDAQIIPITPDGVTYRFIQLRNKLGLTIRLHDLRHHYASTLLELGVPDLYAMERTGHSTPNMLKKVYQHIKDEKEVAVDESIMKKMNELYK